MLRYIVSIRHFLTLLDTSLRPSVRASGLRGQAEGRVFDLAAGRPRAVSEPEDVIGFAAGGSPACRVPAGVRYIKWCMI